MEAEAGTPTAPPTVVIVDDEPGFLRVLRDLIAASERFEVVGEANCGTEALNLLVDLDADVVIIDVQMPDMNGFEATRELLAGRPDLRIVLTSGQAEDAYHRLSTEVGAVGFLPKRELSSESLEALLSSAR